MPLDKKCLVVLKVNTKLLAINVLILFGHINKINKN